MCNETREKFACWSLQLESPRLFENAIEMVTRLTYSAIFAVSVTRNFFVIVVLVSIATNSCSVVTQEKMTRKCDAIAFIVDRMQREIESQNTKMAAG